VRDEHFMAEICGLRLWGSTSREFLLTEVHYALQKSTYQRINAKIHYINNDAMYLRKPSPNNCAFVKHCSKWTFLDLRGIKEVSAMGNV
jgi:hypothetical protein